VRRALLFGLALLLLVPVLLPGAGASGPGSSWARRLVSFDAEGAPAAGSLFGGVRVVEAFPSFRVALLEGDAAHLDALAGLPGVAGVYPEEPLTLELDRARQIDRADPPAGEQGSWPTGRNVTVAVVDSGIDATHPGFAGRVEVAVRIARGGSVEEGRGDLDGHGTHVAGIVAGSGAKSPGNRLHGLAPEARLASVDISDSFTTTNAVRAFQWIHDHRVEHNIRVVSNSWGREKADAHYDPDDPVIRASDGLVADGLVVVFSAGNRGHEGAGTLTTEASNPNVITVGSASPQGGAETYSSRGPARDADGKTLPWIKPDISAPGSAITSARSQQTPAQGARDDQERYYVAMNGTSMAAPQVAAAAALLLDAHPALTPSAVASLLRTTARDVAAPGPDADTGAGMLDVRAALAGAESLEAGHKLVVIESNVPIHEQGTILAAQGLVLLHDGTPRAPPASDVTIPLEFPTGAAHAQLWLNWSGPGTMRATLEGPDGTQVLVPSGANSLVLAGEVKPGRHALRLMPEGVHPDLGYSLEGDLLLRHQRLVDLPGELNSRAPYVPTGSYLSTQSGASRVLGLLAAAPMLVVAMTAGAATLGVALRGKKA